MTQHEGLLGRGSLPRIFVILAVVGSALLLPGTARGQELYSFSAGLLGGIGGSLDADPGDDLGNTGFQLNFGMVTEPRTLVGFRFGRLALDKDELFGSLSDAQLSYLTVAGEYRFTETYSDSGIYIGLGGYRLEGTRGGRDETEDAIGLSAGVTGEFQITHWLGVLLELSGHYANFDEAQFFAMGHAGLAFHF